MDCYCEIVGIFEFFVPSQNQKCIVCCHGVFHYPNVDNARHWLFGGQSRDIKKAGINTNLKLGEFCFEVSTQKQFLSRKIPAEIEYIVVFGVWGHSTIQTCIFMRLQISPGFWSWPLRILLLIADHCPREISA